MSSTSEYTLDTVISPADGRRGYKSVNAASQREKLRQKILEKYLQKYNHLSNTLLIDEIIKEVDFFFTEQKMNEKNMHTLKQRIQKLSVNPNLTKPIVVAQPTKQLQQLTSSLRNVSLPAGSRRLSQITKKSVQLPPQQGSELSISAAPSQVQDASLGVSKKKQNQQPYEALSENSDNFTATSKSASQPQFLKDQSWVDIINSDVRAYQKEQVLSKYRSLNQKATLKAELDRQLVEKSLMAKQNRDEHQQYYQLSQDIARNQGILEEEKERERAKHRRAERKIIELQVSIEMMQKDQCLMLMFHIKKIEQERKRLENRIANKQMEDGIIMRIAQEQQDEENKKIFKKRFEKQRQQAILVENSKNKQRIQAETQKERIHDIESQRNYLKLLDAQEEARQKEKRERLEKIQQLTKQYEQTVQKDMREQQRSSDERMFRSIMEKNHREDELEDQKRNLNRQQQADVNATLAIQIDEKKRRHAEEMALNQRQAQIWRDDRDQYLRLEKQKKQYIDEVYKQNQDILLEQMGQRNNGGARSTNNSEKLDSREAKYNKSLLKSINNNNNSQLPGVQTIS